MVGDAGKRGGERGTEEVGPGCLEGRRGLDLFLFYFRRSEHILCCAVFVPAGGGGGGYLGVGNDARLEDPGGGGGGGGYLGVGIDAMLDDPGGEEGPVDVFPVVVEGVVGDVLAFLEEADYADGAVWVRGCSRVGGCHGYLIGGFIACALE